jgi:hypothetical protein
MLTAGEAYGTCTNEVAGRQNLRRYSHAQETEVDTVEPPPGWNGSIGRQNLATAVVRGKTGRRGKPGATHDGDMCPQKPRLTVDQIVHSDEIVRSSQKEVSLSSSDKRLSRTCSHNVTLLEDLPNVCGKEKPDFGLD